MNNTILNKLEQANVILTPKGENRTRVNEMLISSGIKVPKFSGRCLH